MEIGGTTKPTSESHHSFACW